MAYEPFLTGYDKSGQRKVYVMADGKLRNMSSIYIEKADKMLLLYRQGGRVVNDVWVGSAGGHFEEYELNNARALRDGFPWRNCLRCRCPLHQSM